MFGAFDKIHTFMNIKTVVVKWTVWEFEKQSGWKL